MDIQPLRIYRADFEFRTGKIYHTEYSTSSEIGPCFVEEESIEMRIPCAMLTDTFLNVYFRCTLYSKDTAGIVLRDIQVLEMYCETLLLKTEPIL